MLSLEVARNLKNAGLTWQPQKGDQFIVPDRGLDEQVFAVNDMAVIIETLQGSPALTFHGTPEWALDYVYLGEVVWLPNETQLRGSLQAALAAAGSDIFDLLYADGVYTCRFEWRGERFAFRAADAVEGYASALLHLIGSSEER
jgi:hypothetical protein